MIAFSPTKQSLTTAEMLEYSGLTRSGLHRARTAPDSDFPSPFVLPVAQTRNLWDRGEIDAWLIRNRLPSPTGEPRQLRGSQRGKSNQHAPAQK